MSTCAVPPLQGISVVVMLTQGGAARLAPLRFALGFHVAAPLGRRFSPKGRMAALIPGHTLLEVSVGDGLDATTAARLPCVQKRGIRRFDSVDRRRARLLDRKPEPIIERV